MSGSGILLALALGALLPTGSNAYVFPHRQLTFNGLTKNSITMNGSVAGWVSCVPDPIDEFDPQTCEVWVYDANTGDAAHAITDNAVEDECVAIDHRDVVFRRGVGAGQVVLRDLDGGETILSSAGIDAIFYACPQISPTRVVWQRGTQVVVYDRALAAERVVGSSASYMDLSGDYVVWQEGADDASEVWFLDASSPANTPQRLTNNAIPDGRPTVQAIPNSIGVPMTSPSVAWNRVVADHYEVSSWNGSATTPVTTASTENQFFPVVTLGFEQPVIAWSSGDLHYCTTCDGSPSNVLELPASDPFLAGSPSTWVESINGGWIVFWRVFPFPSTQFDIGFYEIDGAVVTPITDDAELDDAAELGFRSVAPTGPAVVWRRATTEGNQVFYAPESGGPASFGALLALGALARRRRGARLEGVR